MKFSRVFLWTTFLILGVTGIALLWLAPAPDELPHPFSGVLREFHGLGVMLGLVLFGYMIGDHVQKKLGRHRRPWDGYAHLMLWGIATVTGFLLYYPQEFIDNLDISVAQWHGYFGVALVILAPLHGMRQFLKRMYYRLRYHQKSKTSLKH